ncbi:phage integrase SAM-like domain-containing protein [Pedobacter sp. MW01-1-1]|uniref:phage integrase SAM-like domain-containing protein n=1 Tax=Pedobacter sp. MW01-1-1 TaxID=3383027 RepID=UPI003FEE4B3A
MRYTNLWLEFHRNFILPQFTARRSHLKKVDPLREDFGLHYHFGNRSQFISDLLNHFKLYITSKLAHNFKLVNCGQIATELGGHHYRILHIDIRNIDHLFIADYEFFLRTTRKCNNNSAVKYIKNLKKVIKRCLAWTNQSTPPYSPNYQQIKNQYFTTNLFLARRGQSNLF